MPFVSADRRSCGHDGGKVVFPKTRDFSFVKERYCFWSLSLVFVFFRLAQLEIRSPDVLTAALCVIEL